MSRFVCTNNHLAALLAIWAIWTQIKDGVAGWTIRQARAEAVEARAAALDREVGDSRRTIAEMNGRILDASKAVESAFGNINGVDKRSYEADQAMRRDIDDVRKLLQEARATNPKANVQ